MLKHYELSQIINFDPILLYKVDLEELESLLLDSSDHENDKIKISLTSNDRTFRVESIKELFEKQHLPEHTDKLTVSINYRISDNNINDIYARIKITMNYNYVSCQISSTNEDFYNGKLARLKTFFKNKKPWYSVIQKYLHYILLILFVGTLIKAFESTNNIQLGIYSILSFLLIGTFILIVIQKIFPYVRIYLKEKNKTKISIDKIATVLGIFAAIATIYDLIIKNIFTK